MNDDSVHNPELPGVRTYGKDTADEKSGFSFGGITMTVPEKAVEKNTDTAQSGGRINGGKELFNVERAFNDDAVQEGTIVTDRKKRRMSTGSLLKSAFTEWWSTTQKSMETTVDKLEFLKPKEEVTMEDPVVRTNVIQEAAKFARQAPRDDHALATQKVRTFAHDAEVVTGKPFTIKEPTSKGGVHWAKTEEKEDGQKRVPVPETPLQTIDLRTSSIAPTIGKHTSTPLTAYAPKIVSPQPSVHAHTSVQTERPTIASMRTPEKMVGAPLPQQKKEAVWSHFSNTKNATVDLRVNPLTPMRPGMNTPRIETTPVSQPLRSVAEASPIPRRQPEVVTPVVFERQPEESTQLFQPVIESRQFGQDQNHPFQILTVLAHIPRSLIIATIVIVGGGLGVLTAILVMQNKEDAQTEVSTAPLSTPTFLTTNEQTAFTIGKNRREVYTALRGLGENSSITLEQFYPTVITHGQTVPASSEEIMRVLAWNAPGTFTRGLGKYMMFGVVNGTIDAPFIIVQSTNFDVAFAGMLSWERNMSDDLAPLFGESLPNVGFTDALTSNRSIRILKEADGKERIVYGFVNKNLIVITTSTEALAKIIERIK